MTLKKRTPARWTSPTLSISRITERHPTRLLRTCITFSRDSEHNIANLCFLFREKRLYPTALNYLSFSSQEIKRQKWNHACGVHRQRLWEKVKLYLELDLGLKPTFTLISSVVSLSPLFIFYEKSWSLISRWAVEINRRWYMEKCLVPGLTHSGCSKDMNFPLFFPFIPHCNG